ncbi:hypothetical protein QBC33DRAFT_559727 [Phialemonium atrogriseum]|uniref:Uncharacterized protein n=1 Tax=Phialemonium atrogriseum TaxID=1093897 RepID=A0AAJ0FFA7_9PEZI|nr:uncharacterized protein QBC33DRAFT_559727 [Phialemonium atrogriseum]KAK1766406.1 hypothetical protein QBC33DRAFT_559727 [Phialemonium atrogriseum]
MGRGKMDEAAAERIRRARGDKDEFARRASVAARQNKESGPGKSGKKDGKNGNDSRKEGGGGGSQK